MPGIILEGMDNTGKSTLAKQLSDLLKIPVYHSGPAPDNLNHAIDCMIEQVDMVNAGLIVDRITGISDRIYQEDRFHDAYEDQLSSLDGNTIIIYCRPPRRTIVDFSAHEEKSYDTVEHLEKLAKNKHRFIDAYDELFQRIPHVRYDWTDPMLSPENLAREILRCRYVDGYQKKMLEALSHDYVPTA